MKEILSLWEIFYIVILNSSMQVQEIEQIKNILVNYESSSKKIPYLSDLETHSAF